MELVENTEVRQREDEGFRRWFLNDFFDVIVWYEHRGGPLKGFQICYNKNRPGEKAYSRFLDKRGHHLVSSRDSTMRPGDIGTAILQGDGGTMDPAVINRFAMDSVSLPGELRTMMLQELRELASEEG